jgi:hypothetical protein
MAASSPSETAGVSARTLPWWAFGNLIFMLYSHLKKGSPRSKQLPLGGIARGRIVIAAQLDPDDPMESLIALLTVRAMRSSLASRPSNTPPPCTRNVVDWPSRARCTVQNATPARWTRIVSREPLA